MPEPKQDTEKRRESELETARWAVISFERCEATGLTYEQASEKLAELEKQSIAGLCVVTDETGARVNP